MDSSCLNPDIHVRNSILVQQLSDDTLKSLAVLKVHRVLGYDSLPIDKEKSREDVNVSERLAGSLIQVKIGEAQVVFFVCNLDVADLWSSAPGSDPR